MQVSTEAGSVSSPGTGVTGGCELPKVLGTELRSSASTAQAPNH